MVVRIIGIDPGLRRTGWGVIESSGPRLSYIACGTVTSDATEALSQRLAALFTGLDAVLRQWQPHEAAVEETFVNRDAHATLKLGQARGIALLVPARAGLTVAEYAPNLVKKTVTGSGHAEKVQIRTMIGYLLPRASPDTDDAADALAVAIAHAHHRGAAALKRALLAAHPAPRAKRLPAA
jgi:crossover junction endodeoxyribonuclease RuvC